MEEARQQEEQQAGPAEGSTIAAEPSTAIPSVEPSTAVPFAIQRWEYKARNLQKVLGPMIEGDFNNLGREGWEFVAMAQGGKSGYAIFKRPLR